MVGSDSNLDKPKLHMLCKSLGKHEGYRRPPPRRLEKTHRPLQAACQNSIYR